MGFESLQGNLHLKDMKNRKQHIFPKLLKTKSTILLFLYLTILTITIIHHHPIDLGNKSKTIDNNFNEETKFLYSLESCPIITFSQSGFNGLIINYIQLNGVSETKAISFNIRENLNKLNYPLTNLHRGPPTPLV